MTAAAGWWLAVEWSRIASPLRGVPHGIAGVNEPGGSAAGCWLLAAVVLCYGNFFFFFSFLLEYHFGLSYR